MKYVAEATKLRTMKCGDVKGLLSPYLDGAVTGLEMQGLQSHLEGCAACMREYRLLRQTQRLLTSVGRVPGTGGPWTEVASGDFAGGGGGAASAV